MYEIISNWNELAKLRDDWQSLYDSDQGNLFGLSFDWIEACWEFMVDPKSRLFCLVERREGVITLIWPLILTRQLAWTIARPLNSQTSEYSEVLVSPSVDRDEAIRAALREVIDQCPCDILLLPDVPQNTPLGQAVAAQRSMVLNTQPSPWVRRADYVDWEDYWTSRDRFFRSDLERQRRRLQALGPLEMEQVVDPDEADRLIDWMMVHKQAGIDRKGLTNPWMFSARYRRFLTESLRRFPVDMRCVFVLKSCGVPIAAELSSIDRTRVEWFIGAYDQNFSAYSPGQLTKAETLRWAFERGLDYDFRPGDEVYKRKWTHLAETVETRRLVTTIWGHVFVAKERVKAWLKAVNLSGRRSSGPLETGSRP